ncbi:uncharacterized protein LOC126997925 [Eriocheir sinensis]|uniref:uncharacterized protein LOC126997925 n=1 Tax=Eriocheir sinensis TaxID=95602 RepID=UPI0021CAD226|nr:uncharacterized protein LOC126997925 [Eriocheir sinensis]
MDSKKSVKISEKMCDKRTGLLLWTLLVVVMVVVGDDSQYCTLQDDASNPPKYPDIALQYTLKTETSKEFENEEKELSRMVTNREYVYDGLGSRIALKLISKFYDPSYINIMDWNTKQLIISAITEEYNNCMVKPVEEAIYLFPVLDGADKPLSADRMPDPGVLLGVQNWTETHYKGTFDRRGIPSERWEWCGLIKYENDYETHLISMATYWSVPGWMMPIPTDQTASLPVGWEVLMWQEEPYLSHDPLITSVMYYEPGLVDHSLFLIPQGSYCKDLVPEPGHPFPDFSQDRFFSFSLEYRDTDTKYFMWADAWYDFGKKLYRIDHDRNKEPSTTTSTRASNSSIVTTTLLLDYNDGVAFEFVPGTLLECRVSLVNATQQDWATLTGLDHLWADSPSAFFGSDTTNYTYYGERLERYMVVGDWRGERTDWPPGAMDEKTDMLWQWTFTNKNVSTMTSLGDHVLVEKQVPIGVRINPIQTGVKGEVRTLKSTVAYSIYDFEVDEEGKNVDFNGVRVFDAYDCYSANLRDHLRFKLDVTSWPEVVWTPLLTSTYLNEHWHVTLANYGQVSPIRITRVQTIVEEEDEVWVEFVLLYRHYIIGELDPELFESMTTGEMARSYLTAAVNNGDIKYDGEKPDGEKFTILALYDSLTTVVEPDCTTTTSTSTTTRASASSPSPSSATSTTSTTTPHMTDHSTNTPPQNSLTSTTAPQTTTPGDSRPAKENAMYTPGDLAGLGIGMLLMGLALGAGGAFLVVVKGVHQTVMGWCTKT